LGDILPLTLPKRGDIFKECFFKAFGLLDRLFSSRPQFRADVSSPTVATCRLVQANTVGFVFFGILFCDGRK
jgi:nitrous oxidase accessory protein NosD